MSAPGPALRLDGLAKSFGDHAAVDDVTLDVPSGSFFGLVGPNGAGKTTLLSMATGLIRPDAGTSAVAGHDIWSDPDGAKAALGVLASWDLLPPRLTGRECLTGIGLLRAMAPDTVAARCSELLEVLGLADAADVVVGDYSTGMHRKISLAAALLHGPRVLVLDEPLESVDPLSAATIRSILAGFRRSGGTIVFSSHVMALVESLCDRVAIMADGRIVRTGPLDEIRQGRSLDDVFAESVGAENTHATLSWFGS